MQTVGTGEVVGGRDEREVVVIDWKAVSRGGLRADDIERGTP